MARPITVIQQQMIDLLISVGINVSGSRTSVRRKWTYVFAYCAWVVESLFDTHKDENNAIIKTLKPHSTTWYKTLALSFQNGQAFNPDTGEYDNVGLTDEQIQAQKIIAQSAVTEVETPTRNYLRIKVAKLVNGDLAPISEAELSAFSAFIEKRKDSGNKIVKESLPPDALKLELEIFYDPLILSADGSRIDGLNATPVPDAINEYLRDPIDIPFNGEYSNTRLMDKLQRVEGVKLVSKRSAKAKFGLNPFNEIDERYVPDAGYMRVAPGDLTINYRPYV